MADMGLFDFLKSNPNTTSFRTGPLHALSAARNSILKTSESVFRLACATHIAVRT